MPLSTSSFLLRQQCKDGATVIEERTICQLLYKVGILTADEQAAHITHALQIFVWTGITSFWNKINSHLQANYLFYGLIYGVKT